MENRAKSVLITGASSGIGLATAEYLKSRGWRVLAAARTVKAQEELAGKGLESLRLDVTDSDSVKSAISEALERTKGELGAVVNNAGILIIGAVEDISLEGVRRLFETNLFGALEVTRQLIPAFRRNRFGRIVFISSPNSNGFGYPFLGIESATKAALEVSAGALGRELKGSGVSVSTVCPGEMRTGILLKAVASLDKYIKPDSSVHADRYRLLRKHFSSPAQVRIDNDPMLVAKAIEAIIAANRPPRRIIVPLKSKLHYLAHTILPEWLQDRLVFEKMKKNYGIRF